MNREVICFDAVAPARERGLKSIKTAARLMQKSEMFVRMGLRSGALPFGVAIHASSKKSWAYHISPAKFAEYMGITPLDLEAEVWRYE